MPRSTLDPARERGFNLIEVMVALIVISVGLLGIAKMQALAMASTGTAKMRSLAALEASSLASTLRADRSYWASIAAGTIVTVTIIDGAITASDDAALQGAKTCEDPASPCTTAEITAYDLRQWATALATQMPRHTATVDCRAPAAANPGPVTCTIQMNWIENRVSLDSKAAPNAVLPTTFSLSVQP